MSELASESIGWAFPPSPATDRGGIALRAGTALLRQSIELILRTEPGERVMRPGFGAALRRFLMAPNTPATRSAIAREVDTALTLWEPRIAVREVRAEAVDDPALVLVTVVYAHLPDGTGDVLAFPLRLGG